MIRYVLQRLLLMVPTFVAFGLLGFLLVRLVPGTVVEQILGMHGFSEAGAATLRQFFGLDQPIHEQYFSWMGRLLRGDLGVSWRSGIPVAELIAGRMSIT